MLQWGWAGIGDAAAGQEAPALLGRVCCCPTLGAGACISLLWLLTVCALPVVSVAGCVNFVLPCLETSAVQEQD